MPDRDQRASNFAYYHRNREQELSRVRRRQNATRDYLRQRRREACPDCAQHFRPHQMDFDHRDPAIKSFRLTAGHAMLMAQDRLGAEIAKCDVVCANCHRIRTWHRQLVRRSLRGKPDPSPELTRKRRYWRAHAAMLDGLKQQPCADCGLRFPACVMDFDHRDPATKRYTISRMIGRAGNARIMAEVDKCDIVCANCHRDRTFMRHGAGSSERE